MRALTPDEEAAFRLGDSAHMRAFIEEATLLIYRALLSGKYEINDRVPTPAQCAEFAGEMWDETQKQVKARGGG